MPTADLSRIRNFGIVAHIDAGKTTLSERLLFYTGKEHAMGEVHEGTAKMDYLPEEQERGITITAAATTMLWGANELHLIDTPGHVDFTAEVERSLRVLDGAVVVFDAVNGVEAQSETVWRQATRYHVPRCCFLNKMDRPGADFERSLASIRTRLGAIPAPITMPVGAGETLAGVIDLVAMEMLTFDPADKGRTIRRSPIPAEARAEAEIRRQELVDLVVDHSESAGERFLSGAELSIADLEKGIREACLRAAIFPTLCGSAFKNLGVQTVLDAVCKYLPSPLDVGDVRGRSPKNLEKEERRAPDPDAPLCALAFKIVGDSHGDLVFARIYSGTLEQGMGLWNPRLEKHERAMRLLRMHANEREPMERAVAGDIVALVGLKETATGDTLCDRRAPIVLESMHFPEPVMSMRIEPRTNADRDRLIEALARLAREDPTFRTHVSADTGEMIIEGMGELHLEVLTHRLVRDLGVAASVGKPRVAARRRRHSRRRWRASSTPRPSRCASSPPPRPARSRSRTRRAATASPPRSCPPSSGAYEEPRRGRRASPGPRSTSRSRSSRARPTSSRRRRRSRSRPPPRRRTTRPSRRRGPCCSSPRCGWR